MQVDFLWLGFTYELDQHAGSCPANYGVVNEYDLAVLQYAANDIVF